MWITKSRERIDVMKFCRIKFAKLTFATSQKKKNAITLFHNVFGNPIVANIYKHLLYKVYLYFKLVDSEDRLDLVDQCAVFVKYKTKQLNGTISTDQIKIFTLLLEIYIFG